ncbi:Excinuclease ABC subunit A [Luteitalea pratensis]|uniref:UvrABC system protein A n=1 Tax=Luteitalea pratensis TaxID=1855912 RepID=A0A143PU08_LUTPR|nr:excinuclease ABC subunit UvrA [Luteitalea pratensis]AMY11284.1 Excinuclease ABC subunit A [Luteitalea pratensis]
MPTPPTAPIRDIVVKGARTHNLKQVDVTLPARKLVVITGVSGSGKSSLAFDTIYAEGQRRYVESLSAYARQFLERMERPDVDSIHGISPAIAIRQKNSIRNPRSTVGTTTEIHDYLRLLFARVGRTFCRNCGREVIRESAEVVAQRLAGLPTGTRLLLGFEMPIVSLHVTAADEDAAREDDDDGGTSGRTTKKDARLSLESTLETLRRRGFTRVLLDGQMQNLADVPLTSLEGRATLEVIVDRIKVAPDVVARLTDSLEVAYQEGGGAAFAIELPESNEGAVRASTEAARAGETSGKARVDTTSAAPVRHVFSERFECRTCGIPYEVPQPRLFSFNNPFGACPTCHGFGNVMELDLGLVVPNPGKTLTQGAIDPWTKPQYRGYQTHLKRQGREGKVRLDVPWEQLSDAERAFVVDGDGSYEGVRGFFALLERKKYKVHVRVFLSRYRGYQTCPDCGGARLRREARDVQVQTLTIDRVGAMTVREALDFFASLALSEREAAIADKLQAEIVKRLTFLSNVGLDYLTLDRLSSTLSGGESQRISLATSLGSALVGTLYVLDEPSIGLHPRDNLRLIGILRQLRDQGNTVLVVEHDADMIAVADEIIDMGLGAGELGGRVVYAGSLEGLRKDPRSLTGKYLRDDLAIPVPATRRKPTGQKLRVLGATEHNLKNIDVEVPLGLFTVVTGVSGSGKSTLVHDVIHAGIKRAKGEYDKAVGACRRLEGVELVSDVILVDQAPIGRTPRSNPVTYLKAFDPIREIFATTKDARTRGLTASSFSFNVPGGRCDACEGEGQVRVEMQFLADVFVPCDVCDGTRFRPQVLEVTYRGKNIHQVLDLTVREALQFFNGSPKVLRRLQVLEEIGLGYLRLGQPATTLSGGEAQRVKIAAHLSTQGGERMLYILDEPTTGLHFDDIAKLLAAFRKLLAAGHSLLVIEHNLDVIKTADWVIDLGPEGGYAGGEVVAVGSPETIVGVEASHTGRHLRAVLEAHQDVVGRDG